MMEPRLTFGGLLLGSAGSPEAYRDAASGGAGRMTGYLALLIAAATLVVTAQAQVAAVAGLKQAGPWLKQRVPEIRIASGQASSPAAQPYVVEEESFGFVVDTTGATQDLDPKYTQGLLLTKTELIVRKSKVETRRYSLERMPDTVINAQAIDAIITTVKTWLWVAVAIGVFVGLWVMKLLQVVCWSVFGLLIKTITNRPLPYRALWNIGIYALTVPLAFDLVKGLFGWRMPGLGLLSLSLYAGYFVWGILVQPVGASER